MLQELSKPFRYKRLLNGRNLSPAPGGSKKKLRAEDWVGTLQLIWSYLGVNKGKLALVLLLILLSSALSLLGPFLLGKAVDAYIVAHKSSGFFLLLLGLAGVFYLLSASNLLQNFLMIDAAQHTVFRMRRDLFRHFHFLPIPFFDKRQQGELMSRITNDIENVSSTLNSSIIQIGTSLLTLIGSISVMVWLSAKLTLVTMLIVPVMFFAINWITRRTGKLFKELQQNLGEMNGYIEETISGHKVVKAFSREENVIQAFWEKNEKLKNSGFWSQTFSGFIPKVMNFLNNISFTLIVAIGGLFALKGYISIGTIVIFAEYSRQFTRPLNDLSNQFNTMLSAVAGAERVFEVIVEEAEGKGEESKFELTEVRGEVEFSGVAFAYETADATVEEIDFHAKPGETIALVGPTGAGKTTIINLLARFYQHSSGIIRIDGCDISRISRENLRRHMAFVMQDTYLFQGTIRENIRYGKLEASDREVEQAAEFANAHAFIMKLPKRYDTMLKQDGGGISQGQKQLLSIARAVLANPSILILDEATSSIDTITEMNIQDALHRLMAGRTSIVIAHRLNTVRQAEQILVMNGGRIIERGTHDSLLAQRGFYYGLYNS